MTVQPRPEERIESGQPEAITALTLLGPAPPVSPSTEHRADQHPAAVYLASLNSEKGRRAMRHALAVIAAELGHTIETLPWSAMRYPHAQALRAKLVARYSPATVNRFLCALRGVLREAMRLGLMTAEDSARACDIKGVKGSRLPRGRALSAAEVMALLKACNGATVQGARDAAIVALLYGAGLRRAELVELDLDHVEMGSGALRVLGKGNKERVVYATGGGLRALRAWLATRGGGAGPLFCAIAKGSRVTGRRLTDQAVLFILGRLASRAGIERLSPHDLRRTFISDLLDAGADLSTVQKLAGHAQVTTTQRYDRRDERSKLRAAELLRVPFEG